MEAQLQPVVLMDPDPSLPGVRTALVNRGVRVEWVVDSKALVACVLSCRPSRILLAASGERGTPETTEWLNRLASLDETRQVPVTVLSPDASERVVLETLWARATDVVCAPWRLDLDAWWEPLDPPAACAAQPRNRRALQGLLRFFRRSRRDGVLVLNSGTPFEGHALFSEGALTHAKYGALEGEAALEEMLWFEEDAWQLGVESLLEPKTEKDMRPPTVSVFPSELSKFPPRLLLVGKESELTTCARSLKAQGFEVTLLETASAAFDWALTRTPDGVLADASQPKLDGWGLLRQLKTDHRTREIPVVFLSTMAEPLTWLLQAAKAGAHDSFSKLRRPEAIASRMEFLLQHHSWARWALLRTEPLTVDVRQVGVQWLLRRLAELSLSGTVQVEEPWGVHRLHVDLGVPLDAVSHCSSRETRGLGAVAALLEARSGTLSFVPETPWHTRQLDLSMEDMLQKVCVLLNRLEDEVVLNRLHSAKRFVVDEELLHVYELFADGSESRVARAVCEEHVPPAQLSRTLNLSPTLVDRVLHDMVRRQIIQFAHG